MNNITIIKNQLITQDETILSGQKLTNPAKIKAKIFDLKCHCIIDDIATLGRVGVLSTEYDYSGQSFNSSTESRDDSRGSSTILRAEHEVYSIEVN